MTQTTYEAQTLTVAGIPRIEYRTPAPAQTNIYVCFTPSYSSDEYGYPAPKFVWGQEVALVKDWESVKESGNLEDLHFHKIATMRPIEKVLPGTNRLSEEPYWIYAIAKGKYDLVWLEEDELILKQEITEEFDEF